LLQLGQQRHHRGDVYVDGMCERTGRTLAPSIPVVPNTRRRRVHRMSRSQRVAHGGHAMSIWQWSAHAQGVRCRIVSLGRNPDAEINGGSLRHLRTDKGPPREAEQLEADQGSMRRHEVTPQGASPGGDDRRHACAGLGRVYTHRCGSRICRTLLLDQQHERVDRVRVHRCGLVGQSGRRASVAGSASPSRPSRTAT
jgi:hypothetical protein